MSVAQKAENAWWWRERTTNGTLPYCPWASELPETLSAAQGRQLAIDRIAWRDAGRPDPAEADQWLDDEELDYLLDRHSHDTLDLGSLKLRTVPEELYRTEGIKFLFLMDNRIETISERFAQTFRLEGLSRARW